MSTGPETAALPKVTIYSDGACAKNPGGRGGWAAILIYGENQKVLRGAHPSTTNNRMEMFAAIEALRALKRRCHVEFFTDSEYLRKGISIWLPHWIRRGWKTKEDAPVKNQDLWKQLHSEAQKHHIDWKWVKGHADSRFNTKCDRIARKQSRKKSSAHAPANPLPHSPNNSTPRVTNSGPAAKRPNNAPQKPLANTTAAHRFSEPEASIDRGRAQAC